MRVRILILISALCYALIALLGYLSLRERHHGADRVHCEFNTSTNLYAGRCTESMRKQIYKQ